ncbi:MAG TPA: hypothetical protein VH062_10995 [Polyangiaceae bacterium]|nr:hypothetical protein [Polyangiaceae bacterium]
MTGLAQRFFEWRADRVVGSDQNDTRSRLYRELRLVQRLVRSLGRSGAVSLMIRHRQ